MEPGIKSSATPSDAEMAPAQKSSLRGTFQRSPIRDEIIALLSAAPPNGTPIAAILMIPGVGTRGALDQLLMRMVQDREITRIGKGRYTLPRRPPGVAPPIAPSPPPVALIAHQAEPQPQVAPAAREPQAEPQPEPRKAILRDVHEAVAREKDLDRLFGHRKEPFAAPRRDDQRPAESPPAEPMDIGTLCATISCSYGKHGLCPPFRLRQFASGWIASGIDPQHILAEVERHLGQHAASCRSGSGDRLLPHLNEVIHHTWNNRHTAGVVQQRVLRRPRANAPDDWEEYRAKRISGDDDWLGDYGEI